MHQIIALRGYFNKEKNAWITYDKIFAEFEGCEDLKDLFSNAKSHIAKIPEKERFNLFYTINSSTDKKRIFKENAYTAFDIDGGLDKVKGHDKGVVDHARWQEYLSVFASVVKVPKEKICVINSGNGLHLIIAREGKPIREPSYFQLHKLHYTALCDKINSEFKKHNLGGELDPSIFDHRRILRMPETKNVKEGRADKYACVLQLGLDPHPFDLKSVSDVPDVQTKDEVPPDFFRKYPKVFEKEIREGCNFIKWCLDKPNEVSEPLWYAALSIAGKFENGLDFAHELSKGHKDYDPDTTARKYRHAVSASGPRTCANIETLGYDGCDTCPHKNIVISPVSITPDGAIKSEHTGFHIYVPGAKAPKPDYDGLRQYFENETHYKGLETSKNVYVYEDNHYKIVGHNAIEAYAESKFEPKPKTHTTREFLNKVVRTNLMYSQFWNDSIARKINFKNGYLDIDSGTFFEHSPDLGFRYILPYDFDPAATAPTFLNMLRRVTMGDEELQKVILEFMGYSLSNDNCWAQKALVLVGDGSNGKSTLLNVLRNLAGAGNYSSASIVDLKKSEYSRQLLDGKLFNISEEMPTNALVDTSLFKDVVAGGELQVRQIYKEAYFMKNRAKFIFSCNTLPDAGADTSHGYYRRLVIVPFNALFSRTDPDYDPHIEKKLEKELPGIFNMALEGYKRLVAQKGFTDASQVADTIRIYQRENDSVLNWFQENTIVEKEYFDEKPNPAFSPIRDLYTNYKITTEGQGRKPVTFAKFSRDLKKFIPDYDDRYAIRRAGDKANPQRGIRGVTYGDGIGLERDVQPNTREAKY